VLAATEPSDDVTVVSLRVLPKPVAGCVRTSGVAGQQGITWPAQYKWVLGRVPSDAAEHAGCWMLDNMIPEAPPIDVRVSEGVAKVSQARAPPASMSLAAASRAGRRTRPVSMAAYSTLTIGDRKVIFNEQMGKGFGIDQRHTQIPMATQSFVNEMITSEGLAMNTPRYRYSRVFAVGYDALCNVFLSAGVEEKTAKLVRDSLCESYEFEPSKVYADAADLLKLAEGKSEEEVLALEDMKELASKDVQYSYTLGAGLVALMKQASVEPNDESIKRWCAALNIKSVNSFVRDMGYFNMNVEKFGQMKEMFEQMKVSAAKKKANDLAAKAKAAGAEADAAEAAEKATAEKVD